MMQAGKREEIAAGSHILVISNEVMIVLDDISDNIHSTRAVSASTSASA